MSSETKIVNEAAESGTVTIENGKVVAVDFAETHQGYGYELKFKNIFGDVIQKDLLRWCIYSISLNDPAHQLPHVYDVCLRAKEIFDCFEQIEGLTDLDRSIVYHAALMHDLGCRYNRKDHHIIGYGLVYDYINRYCPEKFDVEHITEIATCVAEHRSSSKKKPSSFLSAIVSVADTSIPNPRTYLKRALQFRLSGETGVKYSCSKDIIDECIIHIQDKFGEKGYHWNSYPDIGLSYYANEWDTFKDLINDESECRKVLVDILFNDLGYLES